MTERIGLMAAILCGGLLGATGAQASTLAFVKASSELDDGRPRSYVFNLVDGKPNTAWCAKPDDDELKIVFGFKKPVKLKQLFVIAGAVQGDKFDARRKYATEIAVSDGQQVTNIPLENKPGGQKVSLNAEGPQITVSVRKAKGGDGPICIGEITPISTQGWLAGKSIYTQVRGLSTPSRRLVRKWVDNADAPERTLLLALDGTFTYRYEPLLEGKPVTLRGKWRGGSKFLRLELGSKTFAMKSKLTKVDDGMGQELQLTLKGKGPHPSLVTDFQPAPEPNL